MTGRTLNIMFNMSTVFLVKIFNNTSSQFTFFMERSKSKSESGPGQINMLDELFSFKSAELQSGKEK